METDEDNDDILVSATNGNVRNLRALLNRVPKTDYEKVVNARDDDYATPIVLAASGGHLAFCSALLDIDVNIDVDACDKDNRTALSFAAENGQRQFCEKLLNKKAAIDKADNKSNTPLHYAAKNGHTEVIKLLMDNEANFMNRNKEGFTPRALANKHGHTATYAYMLGLEKSKNVVALEDPGNVVEGIANLPVVGEPIRESYRAKTNYYKNTFKFIKFLGKGSFAIVLESEHKGNREHFAIKRIRLQKAEEKVMREVKALTALEHPHIVAYKDSWKEEQNSQVQQMWDYENLPQIVSDFESYGRGITPYLYIQMELCIGTLDKYMKDHREKVNAPEFIGYFKQIVSAIKFVHGEGYIHRDLKPSNVLFSQNGQIKVGDFGLAKKIAGMSIDDMLMSSHTAGLGTHLYISAEQYKGNHYSFPTDIFALGVIFFEGLTTFSVNGKDIGLIGILLGLKGDSGAEPHVHHFERTNPEKERQALLMDMCKHDDTARPTAEDIEKRMSQWETSNK